MPGWGITIADAGTKGKLLCCDVARTGECCLCIQDFSDPRVLSCRFGEGKGVGMMIGDKGKGFLEGNEIWAHKKTCLQVHGGADPRISASKIYGGYSEGVSFGGGASRGRLEYTEIWGHAGCGLRISEGAAPLITGNVLLCSMCNVGILGCSPLLTGNSIHSAGSSLPAGRGRDGSCAGVEITGSGTRCRLEGNFVFRNSGFNIKIGLGADPYILKNSIYEGPARGVFFSTLSTTGTLRDNDISAHGKSEVEIVEGASPLLQGNTIHGGRGNGVLVFGRLTGGRIFNNSIFDFPSSGHCLYVAESLSLEITGNKISGAGADGVFVADGSRCLIKDNEILACGECAVVVQRGSDPL